MESVLFVDDEINILNSLKRGLIDEEYECFFASSGKEALKILETHPINVIVTDMRMPEMDGLTLLKEVKEMYPKIVRIVLSGYTQLQQILATINQVDVFKFLTKPWKLDEEFKVVIKQALEYHRLQTESESLKKALESKNISYQNILRNIDEVVSLAKKDREILGIYGKNIIKFNHKVILEFNNSYIYTMAMQEKIYDLLLQPNLCEEKELLSTQVLENLIQFINSNSNSNLNSNAKLNIIRCDKNFTESWKCKVFYKVAEIIILCDVTFLQTETAENGLYIIANSQPEKFALNLVRPNIKCMESGENSQKQEKNTSILDVKMYFLNQVIGSVAQALQMSYSIVKSNGNMASFLSFDSTSKIL